MSELTIEDIERLALNDGDIIVWRTNGPPDPSAERLCELLKEAGRSKCIIIALPYGQGLEILDVGEMRRHGWVRES